MRASHSRLSSSSRKRLRLLRTLKLNLRNKSSQLATLDRVPSGFDLLLPHLASQRRVVSIPGFLSESLVQSVLDEASQPRAYQPYTHSDEDIAADGTALHVTRYLHSKGRFRSVLTIVRDMVLACARRVDQNEGWNLLSLQGRGAGQSKRSSVFKEAVSCAASVRCAEVHEMLPRGCLPYWDHYDVGSLITVDIMLEEPKTGGQFQTPELDGTVTSHNFHRGDALVFPSAKYHRVEEVRQGLRRTLVIEIWSGREVTEDHRCETRVGACKCPAGGGM